MFVSLLGIALRDGHVNGEAVCAFKGLKSRRLSPAHSLLTGEHDDFDDPRRKAAIPRWIARGRARHRRARTRAADRTGVVRVRAGRRNLADHRKIVAEG